MAKERDNAKYEALAHAVQSGVAAKMHIAPEETEPKHLRVGVNMAMVESAALAGLLMEKGVFTEAEYRQALIAMLQREVGSYETFLSNHYGRKITLG